MRALAVLTLLAALHGAHPAPRTGFEFARAGGNIMPFTVSIATSGVVRRSGAAPGRRKKLTTLQLANLDRVVVAVDFPHLPVATRCPNTLPDIATEVIRVGSRTVRVHGTCVPRFQRLWKALSRAAA